MNFIKGLCAALLTMGLIGCNGGGGGNTSTGGVFFTHSQLANEFVRRLNIDAGYDVDLVKTNTLQYNYIVVYDYDLDSYDAYYIGAYNPGENLSRYLDLYDNRFYYDLDKDIGANYYEDFYTGTRFNKTKGSSKDLMKAKAVAEAVRINKSAQILIADFGLSDKKAQKLATRLYQMHKKSQFGLSKQDVNNFTSEFFGTTVEGINSALTDYSNGDKTAAQQMFDTGATLLETSPEQLEEGLIGMFGPQ